MGSETHHLKRQSRNLSRTSKKKNVLPFILIVCEGVKTEPNYFKWYVKNCRQQINIEIKGAGRNTLSLVEYAKFICNEIQSKSDMIFDQVWCVFDKDSFEINLYNRAFQFCDKEGFHIAYSNECFEIWFLLHFNYYNTGMTRQDVIHKLNAIFLEKFSIEYKKDIEGIYDLLKSRQSEAIRNAKKLEISYKTKKKHLQNPSTSVHVLVEELKKYIVE